MNNRESEASILSSFEQEAAPYIIELADKFWLAPQDIAMQIEDRLIEASLILGLSRVVVSGETNNLTVYVFRIDDLIVFTPLGRLEHSPIFQRFHSNLLYRRSERLCLLKKDAELVESLNLPKVALINPSIMDVFPAPRLAICVSYPASFLRKLQKAEVHILDLQLDLTVDEVVGMLGDFGPDIIGISISFGQLPLGRTILRKVFHYAESHDRRPVVVAGNVISALANEELLLEFPELIICMGEGEETLAGIVDWVRQLIPLQEVPGIAYLDGDRVVRNQRSETDIKHLVLPAMDTVEGILNSGGALTMETSRGCSHSACSFCPRNNKPTWWKGIGAEGVLNQLEHYARAFERFGKDARIFMVDEDFFGIDDKGNDKRIRNIMQGILDRRLSLQFEADTRIDQVYSIKMDRSWHLNRMETLTLCKRAGLHRLLLGVESGSDTVLERFNKGISVNEVVFALRILTALGVGLRITFITFDPLMNFKELKDNVAFLGRRDVFLRPLEERSLDYSILYDAVWDNDFINEHSSMIPVYEHVCYMLVNLEILMGCDYIHKLDKWEREQDIRLISKVPPDYNMARHRVSYAEPIIGKIAFNCQKWIDRHFALDYCLKGMYKISPPEERNILLGFRIAYRRLSFLLLKSLVWLFDESEDVDSDLIADDLGKIAPELMDAKYDLFRKDPEDIILFVMDLIYKKMEDLVASIEQSVSDGNLYDAHGRLKSTIDRWKGSKTWYLINP